MWYHIFLLISSLIRRDPIAFLKIRNHLKQVGNTVFDSEEGYWLPILQLWWSLMWTIEPSCMLLVKYLCLNSALIEASWGFEGSISWWLCFAECIYCSSFQSIVSSKAVHNSQRMHNVVSRAVGLFDIMMCCRLEMRFPHKI